MDAVARDRPVSGRDAGGFSMSTTSPSTPSAPSSPEVRRAATFLTRLFPEPRAFDIRLWNGTLIRGDGDGSLTVVINAPGSLRRMLRPPVELSLGEAYLRGDFDLEGDQSPSSDGQCGPCRGGRRPARPETCSTSTGCGGRFPRGRATPTRAKDMARVPRASRRRSARAHGIDRGSATTTTLETTSSRSSSTRR